MSVNNFLNKVDKQEYIFKLLPDFGVFDIAERAMIDENENINKLFFYGNNNEINFRRFLVRSNNEIEIKDSNNKIIKDDDKNIISFSFKTAYYFYRVIIDEQFLSGGFKVSTDGDYMIGVCF